MDNIQHMPQDALHCYALIFIYLFIFLLLIYFIMSCWSARVSLWQSEVQLRVLIVHYHIWYIALAIYLPRNSIEF